MNGISITQKQKERVFDREKWQFFTLKTLLINQFLLLLFYFQVRHKSSNYLTWFLVMLLLCLEYLKRLSFTKGGSKTFSYTIQVVVKKTALSAVLTTFLVMFGKSEIYNQRTELLYIVLNYSVSQKQLRYLTRGL